MTDKELVLMDTCPRLPHGVIVNTPNGDGHLTSITKSMFGNEYGVNINPLKREIFNDRDCDIKPYLRPMSSMSEEEKEEFNEFTTCGRCSNNYDRWGHWGAEVVSYHYDEMDRPFYDFSQFQDLQDWLNKKMFDYRGLIPMGLALKAPKDMYN